MTENTCGFCDGDGSLYTSRDLHKSGGDYIRPCGKCDGSGVTSIKENTVEGRKETYRKSLIEESRKAWNRETEYMNQIEKNLRNFMFKTERQG